jgi:hypothetical protein
MHEILSVRRCLGAVAVAASSLGVAIAGPCIPASAADVPGVIGPATTPPSGEVTTITNTCTTGLVIVLLSPFSTVPCAGR